MVNPRGNEARGEERKGWDGIEQGDWTEDTN